MKKAPVSRRKRFPDGLVRKEENAPCGDSGMPTSRTRSYRREASMLFPVFFLPFFLLGSWLKAENTPQRAIREFKSYCQQVQDLNRRQALEAHLARLQAFFNEYCLKKTERNGNGADFASLNLQGWEGSFPSWMGKIFFRTYPDIGIPHEQREKPDTTGSSPQNGYPSVFPSPKNDIPGNRFPFSFLHDDTRSFQNGSWASTLPAYPF